MRWQWERPPRVIGHRGAPREARENTLPSFEACVAAGVGAVELDARLCADGRVVVHHDSWLGRVIEGEGFIEQMRAQQLRALGVPLLEEVLALPLMLDVELKGDARNADALPQRVLDVVREADALPRVLVTSFDVDLADEYARLAGVPAGAILPYAPAREDLEAYPRLRYVALAHEAAVPEAIALLKEEGRSTLVWTVDEATEARALLEAGADGIITDRPARLARSLAEAEPAP